MAGISITFEDRRFLAALERLAHAGQRPGPVLRVLGTALVDQTVRRFAAGKAPDGTPWAGLNAAYAEIRRPGPILIQSGTLRASVTFGVGPRSVTVGSPLVYAAIHQFGGVIRPKVKGALRFWLGDGAAGKTLVRVRSVTIPARPYLGLSADDEAELVEVAVLAIGRLIDRA